MPTPRLSKPKTVPQLSPLMGAASSATDQHAVKFLGLSLGGFAPLCETCQGLSLDLWCMFKGDGHDTLEEQHEANEGHPGRIVKGEGTKEVQLNLLKNYNSDCPLCRLISQTIRLGWCPPWVSETPDTSSANEASWFLYSKKLQTLDRFAGSHRYREEMVPRVFLATNSMMHKLLHPLTDFESTSVENNRFTLAELELVPLSTEHASTPRRREISRNVDIGLVKRWLAGHQPNITGDLFSGQGFRLIDVVDERLVLNTIPSTYFALSYVWGAMDPSLLYTTTSNQNLLGKKKALSAARLLQTTGKRLSRTIQDAIRLVRAAGARYLWVDALCIVQDNPEERKRLIHSMDNVYENALVTIVAAAGTDADAGICGIRPREHRPFEEVFKLATSRGRMQVAVRRPSLIQQLRRSHWSKRAWTYQEQCLSRRCLYFTEHEVFFTTQHELRREGYVDAETLDTLGPLWWNLGSRTNHDLPPCPYLADPAREFGFSLYQEIVQDYCRRHVTYPRDVFNAFTGIFNRFFSPRDAATSPSTAVAQCVPPHLMPDALLWFPSNASPRRLPHSNIAAPDDGDKLPSLSWSWASWLGLIEFYQGGNAGLHREEFAPSALYQRFSFVREFHLAASDGHVYGFRPRIMAASREHEEKIGLHLHPTFESTASAEGKGLLSRLAQHPGALGFWAPCLRAPFTAQRPPTSTLVFERDWRLYLGSDWIGTTKIDDGLFNPVAEFVALLGHRHGLVVLSVQTNEGDGVSVRTGLGVVYTQTEAYGRFVKAAGVEWRWRFVVLR